MLVLLVIVVVAPSLIVLIKQSLPHTHTLPTEASISSLSNLIILVSLPLGTNMAYRVHVDHEVVDYSSSSSPYFHSTHSSFHFLVVGLVGVCG